MSSSLGTDVVRTVLPRNGVPPNPHGWRWILARWLLGPTIEAVPVFPARRVYDTEILVVRLGDEGAYNTVEVKTAVPQTSELIPMESVYHDPIPNTFIAVDLKDDDPHGPQPPAEYRVVGTFRGWNKALGRRVMLLERAGGETAELAYDDIVAAYWAPAGYRP